MTGEGDTVRLIHRLHENDVFRRLSDEQRRAVAEIGHIRNVRSGERLAQAGSRGAEVFAILKGELRLLAHHGEEERLVRRAHANETVPLAVLLDPPVLITAIEASVETEVLAIPRAALLELCERDPAIGLQVFRAAARSFEERYRKTLNLVVHSLRSALNVARAGAPTSQPPHPE